MNATCRAALVLIALMTGCDAGTSDESTESGFTGETLTLLYVTDVGESVAFYEAIGFDLDFFYDYRAGAYAIEWKQPYVPEYAEVVQPGIRIGLTTVDEPNPVYGGGVRHYFIIENVHDRRRVCPLRDDQIARDRARARRGRSTSLDELHYRTRSRQSSDRIRNEESGLLRPGAR